MKTLHLTIIMAIPIAFFSGMAFAMFVTSHTLNELNSDTKSQVESMLDTMPLKLAINPNTNRIYVMEHRFVNNIEENITVVVIDGTTNEKIVDMPSGAYSQIAVNPNTNRIYLAEHHLINNINENNIEQDGTVSVIDGNTNTKIASIPVGADPAGIDKKID